MSDHERPVEPFSDIHFEDGHVRATLLHDPTVEGLDMAIYLDGSASMTDEYKNKVKGGLFNWIFGKPPVLEDNLVEPQVRWILEYLATKDRNGELRVAYWACGDGTKIEVIGDLKGVDVQSYRFPGPKQFGSHTILAPAIRNYVEYLRRQVKLGAKRGCAVFITDGEIHDEEEVKRVCSNICREMARGQLPRTNFILVGVGNQVNEEQMEEICHEEYPGVGHLWCHRVAEEIGQISELVAVLVDETMTVAAGGTIYDDKGNVVKIYEARLPAILEFAVPEGCRSFTLEVNGQQFTQPLPKDEHHKEVSRHH